MDYVCEEIVIQILARLPAISLVRFMAVCRLWKSIITSPQFRLVSKRPTKLLVHTDRECYSLLEDGEESRLMYETDFPLKLSSCVCATVIGNDNGLLCIRITKPASSGGYYNYYRVIIWNPFIRKHVMIPDDPMYDNIIYITEYAAGFGGTVSGDYKYVRVVGLHYIEGILKKAVDIYSLKPGTWRRKYLDWDIKPGNFSSCGLLRDRLHWICGEGKEIFPFELEDEVFEDVIKVPESIRSYYISLNVTVIRESLAVVINEVINEIGCHSTVWVMEEYGDVNSWIKLWNIVHEEIYRVGINMVHLMKDGDLLLGLSERSLIHSNLKLVTYNQKTRKKNNFDVFVLSSSEVFGFTSYYKESLVLLGNHRAVADSKLI